MGSSELLKAYFDNLNLGSFADAFDNGIFGSIAGGRTGIDIGGILEGAGSTFNFGS